MECRNGSPEPGGNMSFFKNKGKEAKEESVPHKTSIFISGKKIHHTMKLDEKSLKRVKIIVENVYDNQKWWNLSPIL